MNQRVSLQIGLWSRISALVLMIAFFWYGEDFWLKRRGAVARRDLKQNEYITTASVSGANTLSNKFLRHDKNKRESITAAEVASAPSVKDAAIAALALGFHRSLGEALAIGGCVDIWNTSPQVVLVARGAKIVSVVPSAKERRLVFVEVPNDSATAGAVVAAKEPALSIASACSSVTLPKTPTK